MAFNDDDDIADHHPWVRQAIRENNRDRALTLNWRPSDPGEYDRLGLPDLNSANAMEARSPIIAEALAAGQQWISYSRRASYYTGRSRYRPATYSRRAIIPAIDQLAAAGWIEHEKMPQGHRGFQSRFRASMGLLMALSDVALVYEPLEIIVLRDVNGDLMEYSDNRWTRIKRHRTTQLNEGLQAQQIGLDGQIICEGRPLPQGGRARIRMHRVFHRGIWLGGRGYGPFWQNIPKADRKQLTINGLETAEEDYANIHIKLLYQEVGKELVGDAYDLDGWERKHAKRALLIGINARTTTSAIRALADYLRGAPGIADPYKAAQRLLSAVKAKHPDIAHAFGSDAGVRLMSQDAEIAELVMMEMARATGIVPLSVHDSFIVPVSQKGSLMEIMDRALNNPAALVEPRRKITNKTATSLVPEIPQESSEVVPQYGMGDGMFFFFLASSPPCRLAGVDWDWFGPPI
jgi:hypothetical protein